MLNNLNILSKINIVLLQLQEYCADHMSKFIDLFTSFEDISQVSYSEDTPETEVPIQYWNVVKAYLDSFIGKTIPFPEGIFVSIDREDNSYEDYEMYSYIDKSQNDRNVVEIIRSTLPETQNFTLRFLGWDMSHIYPSCDDLVYPSTIISDSQSISSVVSDAISLAYKGELTPSNLMAILEAQSIGIKGEVLSAYNYITGLVSGNEATYQATGLIAAIREIYKSAKSDNIAANDQTNRIDFHVTEFSVATSICLPINQVLLIASSVVSSIVSFFSPIFAVVANAISTAFSGIMAYLDDAYGNTWHFSAEAQVLDNESFTTPLISGTFSDSSLPSQLTSFVSTYGYTKAENMFYTIYAWKNYNQTAFTNVEVFPNVNVDFRRWSTPTPELAYQHMIDSVQLSDFGQYPTIQCYSDTIERTNCSRWCDSDFSPADITKVQYPDNFYRSQKDYVSLWCTYSYLNQLWWICYRIMYLYYGDTASSGLYMYNTDFDLWYWDPTKLHLSQFQTSEEQNLYILQTFMCYWSKTYSDPNYKKSWNNFETWSKHTTGMINQVYNAIKALQADQPLKYSTGLLNDLFSIFNSFVGILDFTSFNQVAGLTEKWSMAPCLTYSDKLLACPPANRYSVNSRLIFTGVLLATIAAGSFAIGLQARKYVQYKANEKVKEIDKLNSKYVSSGSYDDYSAYRSAVLKYNLSYGRLTGTKYDPMMASFVSNKVVSSLAASASALPTVLSDSDGKVGFSVDLNPVISLIK